MPIIEETRYNKLVRIEESESDRFSKDRAPNINVEDLLSEKKPEGNLEDTQRDIPMDLLMNELTTLHERETQTVSRLMKSEEVQTDAEKYATGSERVLHLTIREMWAALLKHYTPEYIFNQIVQRNNRELV